MCYNLCLLCLCLFAGIVNVEGTDTCFPKHFKFGVATSAYQIEGAWNVSGKGESIWDKYIHERPDRIMDGSNADVAADSYNRFKEDVALVKSIGAQHYRFSISWPRILPTGYSNYINPDGIRYYKDLIWEIYQNGLIPMVTMYHWDLPQTLQELGGWMNPDIAIYFQDYARVLLDIFGEQIPIWTTINEPLIFCLEAYSGESAPGYNSTGIQMYMCGHNLMRAHAKVFRMFDQEYRHKLNSVMGIVMSFPWAEANSTSPKDIKAAEVARQFMVDWFIHPIFSRQGDYPPIMRKRIDKVSKLQNYPRSRLPRFTADEVVNLIGASDFMGLNHYTTVLISHADDQVINKEPDYYNDMGVTVTQDPNWPRTVIDFFRSVPWGFRKTLNHIKDNYNNPPVIVLENGASYLPGLRDIERIKFLDGYLRNLQAAVTQDGCNVLAYTYWSLIDNFEWNQGYRPRFGLIEVDFSSPNRTRTPRLSAYYFRELATTKCIPDLDTFLNNTSLLQTSD